MVQFSGVQVLMLCVIDLRPSQPPQEALVETALACQLPSNFLSVLHGHVRVMQLRAACAAHAL